MYMNKRRRPTLSSLLISLVLKALPAEPHKENRYWSLFYFFSLTFMHKTTREWKFGDSSEHDEHERNEQEALDTE